MRSRQNHNARRTALANALQAIGVHAEIDPDDKEDWNVLLASCPVSRISILGCPQCEVGKECVPTTVECFVLDDRITFNTPNLSAQSAQIRSGPWHLWRIVDAVFESTADADSQRLVNQLNEDAKIRSLLNEEISGIDVDTEPYERGWTIWLHGHMKELHPKHRKTLRLRRDLVLAIANNLLQAPLIFESRR